MLRRGEDEVVSALGVHPAMALTGHAHVPARRTQPSAEDAGLVHISLNEGFRKLVREVPQPCAQQQLCGR